MRAKKKKPGIIKKTKVHLKWRKQTKEVLVKKGIYKKTPIGFVLTPKGKRELAFAELFFKKKSEEADKQIPEAGPLESLRIKEGSRKGGVSPLLGTTEFGRLTFWLKDKHAKERPKFRKEHPNPEVDLKKLEKEAF